LSKVGRSIHALAAIWHHFVKHDGVTVRMIDGAVRQTSS
jgi:cytochrome b561